MLLVQCWGMSGNYSSIVMQFFGHTQPTCVSCCEGCGPSWIIFLPAIKLLELVTTIRFFFLDEVPKVKRSLTWVPWPTFRYQHWRPKFVHCTTRWIVVHWPCHLEFKHILIRCLTNIFLDITAALVFQVSDALLPEQAWIKRGLALHARDLAPTRRVYGLGNASTTFCRRAILENWICTAHVTDIISMSTIFS